MFIELVEVLRCIRENDESWLVASIDEMRGRSIRAGTLGCPVCGAHYPIAAGIADFSGGSVKIPSNAGLDSTELAMRAGGMLALGEGTGVVVLGGEWAAGAGPLTSAVDVRVIAVNAPAATEESAAVAVVKSNEVIPCGRASCIALALDDSFGEDALTSALRAVAPGGRIVAPVRLSPPQSLTVLARDASYWVGEKAPEVTPLRRGSR